MSAPRKTWLNPVPYRLIPTGDSMSFQTMPPMATGLPVGAHPGAFGVVRRHHQHEGVDIYVPAGTPVSTVEEGVVVAVLPFTGPHAGMDWWLNTWAVFVEGASGVVVYGEVAPHVELGQTLAAGELVGVVIPVLAKDKGRPRAMLHLERHVPGSRTAPEWKVGEPKPAVLLDPTPYLMEHCVMALLDN